MEGAEEDGILVEQRGWTGQIWGDYRLIVWLTDDSYFLGETVQFLDEMVQVYCLVT